MLTPEYTYSLSMRYSLGESWRGRAGGRRFDMV